MDFGLDEKQEILKKMARDFFDKKCPKSLVREAEASELGYSLELYRSMVDLGWLGIALPEKYGGSGGDWADLTILYEEIGRALVPGPHFTSAVLCAQIILARGTEEQKKRLIPSLSSGKAIATLALYETDVGYSPAAISFSATPEGDGFIMGGTKLFVPFAHIADFFLCVTRTKNPASAEGITLLMVKAKTSGMSLRPLVTLAGDKQSEVHFEGVKALELLGEVHEGWLPLQGALQKGIVVQCAEMVGGAQKALEMAVDYAKQRIQFGRPIGSFQVIQHKCADMVVAVDGARYITYAAACKVKEGDNFAHEVAMAKAYASTAYRRVTKEAHQIFAGVGFMLEHDINLYYRRAKALELNLGDVDYQVMEVARRMGF